MRLRGVELAALAVTAVMVLVIGALVSRQSDPASGAAVRTSVTVTASASASPSAEAGRSAPAGAITGTEHTAPASARPAPSATGVPASGAGAAPRPGPGQRTLTMVNDLRQTIWPAVAADPAHPVAATGWVLPPGASLTIVIPDHWDVRVWARTGCLFDATGNGHCVTGDCDGRFQCGRTWGAFPDTLAEFNLNAWDGMDFYDVSLVEGNNLPMWINTSGGRTPDRISPNGCVPAGCTRDANASCPSVLQELHNGAVVACRSACLAIGGDQTCCLGAWASRAACNPASWPVDSAAVFKRAEPFAYSYVDDDATSVLTCAGECDYRITWGVSP